MSHASSVRLGRTVNITVKTVHICRFTDRHYPWNDRFSVLSQKFCPFKGFLDLKEGVTKLLKGLNPSKALGPDELHPRVLKELATEFGPIFAHLFQQSIDW